MEERAKTGRPALIVCDAGGGLLHASPGARQCYDAAARKAVAAAIALLEKGEAHRDLMVCGSSATLTRLDGTPPTFAVSLAPTPSRFERLSPRQREVATYACAGATSREIAETLGISVHTVRQHLKDIYRVLGVCGRVELARLMMAA